MNKLQPQKLRNCEDCGAPFFSVVGRFCPDCVKKRKSKKRTHFKICQKCQKKRKMFAEQVICRSCILENLAQEELDRMARFKRKMAAIAVKREKLDKYEKCPNFKQDYMGCVTCPAGAWKFKACGRKQ